MVFHITEVPCRPSSNPSAAALLDTILDNNSYSNARRSSLPESLQAQGKTLIIDQKYKKKLVNYFCIKIFQRRCVYNMIRLSFN